MSGTRPVEPMDIAQAPAAPVDAVPPVQDAVEEAPSLPDVVLAAGVVCWRPTSSGDGVQVLLVHRPRYDDWSFPKGKLEADEQLPECAVRELAEETGVEAALGRPLPGTEYPILTGQTKRVSYWAGRAVRTGRRTAPGTEVDDVRWVRLDQARDLLTAPSDRDVLDAFAALSAANELATVPLVVLRHAVTRPRDSWPRADGERPLVAAGRRQATALVRLLRCWRPEHVLSSPWRRCLETLDPFVKASGAKVRTKGGLTEATFRRDPGKAAKHTEKLLNRARASMLCTHRPVLAGVLPVLRTAAADDAVLAALPDEDPYLAPGEALVAHVLHSNGHAPRVVAVERYVAPR